MKTFFVIFASIVLCLSAYAIAEIVTEETFIVEGTTPLPATTNSTVVTTTPGTTYVTTTPGTAVVTSTPSTVIVPAEQEVYAGMSKYHVIETMGQPTYVEKFRNHTRRHHGIYDEVWTYARPGGNLVLYITERRVQKVSYE